MNINLRGFVIVAFLFVSCSVVGEKLPGYIISRTNDTMEVQINVPMKESYNALTNAPYYEPIINYFNAKVTYYGANGKKSILYPSQAKEFGFTYKNTEYTFLSRKDDLKNHPFDNDSCVFLRLQQDGYLKMFDCIIKKQDGGYNPATNTTNGSIYMYEDQYILQKGDGELFQAKPSSFAHQMSAYLSDYKDLSNKIAYRKYKMSDMHTIVILYNSWKAIENRKVNNK